MKIKLIRYTYIVRILLYIKEECKRHNNIEEACTSPDITSHRERINLILQKWSLNQS